MSSSHVSVPDATRSNLAADLTSVSFHHGTRTVLKNITLRIPAGQFLAITGPNGSGKSTLAHILTGLDHPDEGSVTLLGHRVFDSQGIAGRGEGGGQSARWDPDAYRLVRRQIGLVVQSSEDQIVTKPVQDDIAFGPENICIPSDQIGSRVSQALDQTGITPLALADPDHLSGGQQQRVAIAGAWAMRPQLIVLDEPGAMLDERGRDHVMREILRLKASGTTVVLITHLRQWAAQADRVIVLDHHHIIRDGIPSEVLHPVSSSRIQTDSRRSHSLSSRVDSSLEEPAQKPVCLRARNLGFSYAKSAHSQSGQERRWAFRGVNLDVHRGEITVITGTNGAGKSTLLTVLAGLRTPVEGSVERDRGAQIGMILQRPEQQLYAPTVIEDVLSALIDSGMPHDQALKRAHEFLKHIGLDDRSEASPWDLSGGQQRLVGIAGVLVLDPDIVMMDEPFDGLDSHARQIVADLIAQERARGKTVIVVTHDLEDLADLPVHMVRMSDLSTSSSLDSDHESASAQSVSDSDRHIALIALDPRTIAVGCLVVMASVFLINSVFGLLAGAVMVAVVQICGRVSPRVLCRRCAPFAVFIVLMALFNLFAVRTGNVMWSAGPLRMTEDGLSAAVLYSVRLLILVLIGAIVLESVGSTVVAQAISRLCEQLDEKTGHRLTHLGDCALIIQMAFRFLPLVTHEFQRIRFAQRARGTLTAQITTDSDQRHHHRSQSHHSHLKMTVQLLIPVCASVFRHARVLGIALDARCYEPGKPRTHWHQMHMGTADACAWAVLTCWIAGLIAVRVMGI
jgi:energy-coupling factor transporter ATP-binding protein EcfA2/energy-coupling factor transporter transmembrane protein EcfT